MLLGPEHPPSALEGRGGLRSEEPRDGSATDGSLSETWMPVISLSPSLYDGPGVSASYVADASGPRPTSGSLQEHWCERRPARPRSWWPAPGARSPRRTRATGTRPAERSATRPARGP